MPVWTTWKKDSELWVHHSCASKLLKRDGSHFERLVEQYVAKHPGQCRFCGTSVQVGCHIDKICPVAEYSFCGLQSHSKSWVAYVGRPYYLWLPLDEDRDPKSDDGDDSNNKGDSTRDSGGASSYAKKHFTPWSTSATSTSNSSSAPANGVPASNWGRSCAAAAASTQPSASSTSASTQNVPSWAQGSATSTQNVPSWAQGSGWAQPRASTRIWPGGCTKCGAPTDQTPCTCPVQNAASQASNTVRGAATQTPSPPIFCSRATQTPPVINGAPIALPDLYVSASEGESSDGDGASKKDGKTK